MNTQLRKEFKTEWELLLNKEVNTYPLQVEALTDFLSMLGYESIRNTKNGTWHVQKVNGIKNSNPKFMSLEDAVQLYNGVPNLGNNGVYEPLGLSYTFNYSHIKTAHKDKILAKVYLKRSQGEWYVTKHMIKFNNPETFKRVEEVEGTL